MALFRVRWQMEILLIHNHFFFFDHLSQLKKKKKWGKGKKNESNLRGEIEIDEKKGRKNPAKIPIVIESHWAAIDLFFSP